MFPKLESLGIRTGRTPRFLGSRAFVRQRSLQGIGFWSRVDQGRFKNAYQAVRGKCWIPFLEWADVLEKSLAAEGVLK